MEEASWFSLRNNTSISFAIVRNNTINEANLSKQLVLSIV
jgi:hypothetical protein